MQLSNPTPMRRELARAMPDRPFTLRFWDGTELPGTNGGGPVLAAQGPEAAGHLLRAPGQLGLGRAYVTGAITVDDLDALADVVSTWDPPEISKGQMLRLGVAALAANGLRPLPGAPDCEIRPRGRLHALARDSRAVRHHYDVSNEFYAQLLGPSMTYSCAFFENADDTLEDAQRNKLDTIFRKLDLEPGMRLLDVGCGWGALAERAATEYGAEVVGITLSPEQAKGARERAEAAGVSDRVDIRVMDYRDLTGEQFDAIASVGMVEHVGEDKIDEYARRLHALLRPGGALLNHGIAQRRHPTREPGAFSERYVFPDAIPLHVSRVTQALEGADFDIERVDGYPGQYPKTLSAWIRNLEGDLESAERYAGAERLRVWRLYLRAARSGFDSGFSSLFQVTARRRADG